MKISLYKNDCEDMNIEKVDTFSFAKVSKMLQFLQNGRTRCVQFRVCCFSMIKKLGMHSRYEYLYVHRQFTLR